MNPRRFVCVENTGYESSLELGKAYRVIADRKASRRKLVRVIDESGEGYLYPASYFEAIETQDTGRQEGGAGKGRVADEEMPLSPEMIKELQRRMRAARNPIRYMLVSEFTRRFILYYDVTTDTYVMNNPRLGTLFKRREAAESVRKLLSRGVAVVRFTTQGGKLKRLSPFVGFARRSRTMALPLESPWK